MLTQEQVEDVLRILNTSTYSTWNDVHDVRSRMDLARQVRDTLENLGMPACSTLYLRKAGDGKFVLITYDPRWSEPVGWLRDNVPILNANNIVLVLVPSEMEFVYKVDVSSVQEFGVVPTAYMEDSARRFIAKEFAYAQDAARIEYIYIEHGGVIHENGRSHVLYHVRARMHSSPHSGG